MEEDLKFKLKEKTEGWLVLANKEKPTFSIDPNEEEYYYLAGGPFLSQEEAKNHKERLEVFFHHYFSIGLTIKPRSVNEFLIDLTPDNLRLIWENLKDNPGSVLSTHPYDPTIEASTYELNPELVSLIHNGAKIDTNSLILYKELLSITGTLNNSLERPMEIEIHIRKTLV